MRRLVVVSLLAVMVAALGMTVAFAGNYPTFDKEAPRFDAEVFLQMGGPNGEKFITSGLDYDRVQATAKKLGCPYKVYLVRNDDFNACAVVTRIFINRGAVDKCATNSRLAAVIAHEETHIAHEHLRNQYDKQVRDAEQVDNAIQAIASASRKKPGFESNAKLAAKFAKPLMKLAFNHYSKVDEYDADLGGFALLKARGYDVNDALGIFDMMGSGPRGTIAG